MNNKNNFLDGIIKNYIIDTDAFIWFTICSQILFFPHYFNIAVRATPWWISCVWGLGIVLYHGFVLKDLPWNRKFFILAFFYIFAVCFTCLINGAFLRFGFGYILNSLFFLICFIQSKDDKKLITNIAKTYIVIALTFTIINYIFYLVNTINPNLPEAISRIGRFDRTRVSGIMGNANVTGLYDAIAIILSVFLFLTTKEKKWKIISIIAFFLITIEMMITGSRSAIFGCALALIAFIVCYFIFSLKFDTPKKKKNIIILPIIVAIVFLCLIIFVFVSLSVNDDNENIILRTGTSGRTDFWKAGLHYSKSHLLFGTNQLTMMQDVALKSGEIGFTQDKIDYIYDFDNESGMHNSYMQILLVGGLFAAIPFYLLIIGFYYLGIKTIIKRKKVTKEVAILIELLVPMFTFLVFINMFETNAVASITSMTACFYFSLAKGSSLFEKVK